MLGYVHRVQPTVILPMPFFTVTTATSVILMRICCFRFYFLVVTVIIFAAMVLDARIVSALNRIIHNSHFKRRISLEEQKAQKQDRILRGRQIAYLIYEYFRVTGANDSAENYADLCTIVLRNDDIQEFDSKWDGILLSMTKIPPDDILEGLYKLRIRESEKLRTVLELYDLEIHQKKLGPDHHRLKTTVKRSIEQNLRMKNFGARNGNYEKKRRGQESGEKTACTKNSWRLLAMGNQRAVFER